MGIYAGFRTSNSKKINSYSDSNRVGDTFKILSTLQDRQDKAVAKRDEIEAALEDVPVADQDRPAWEKAKEEYKKQLASVPESSYIGDMDRQITKIARKAQKGVQEVTSNYAARQKYIEEGKKLGLDDERLQKHIALSNTQGGLQYDPSTGDFKNRFSGIGFTKAPDTDRIRKVLELMKPSKRKVIQGDRVVETEIFDPSSPENLAIFKQFYDSDPELQKELQFQNAYTKVRADKFDYNSLGEEGKKVANKMMLDNGTYNPQEAYFKQGTTENAQKVFGLITSNALLKYQNDYKEDLSDAGKEKLKFGYDMAKTRFIQDQENYRALLKIKADQQKEDKKAKEEGTGLLTDDIVRAKFPELTDKNGVLEEKGFLSRFGEGIAKSVGSIFSGSTVADRSKIFDTAMNKKYDLGEAGHNYMINNNQEYRALENQIAKTSGKKEIESLRNKQESILAKHEDEIAKEVYKSGTMRSPKLITPTTKKQKEQGDYLLENILGESLSGGSGDGLQIKEIKDSKELAPTTVGAIRGELGQRSTISTPTKVKEKLDSDGTLVYQGMSGFDGSYMNGIRFSINEGNEKREFVVKVPDAMIPQADRFSPTKSGNYIDRQGLSKAQSHFRSEGVVVTKQGAIPVTLEKHKGNTIRAIDKNGKIVETVKIDDDANIIN